MSNDFASNRIIQDMLRCFTRKIRWNCPPWPWQRRVVWFKLWLSMDCGGTRRLFDTIPDLLRWHGIHNRLRKGFSEGTLYTSSFCTYIETREVLCLKQMVMTLNCMIFELCHRFSAHIHGYFLVELYTFIYIYTLRKVRIGAIPESSCAK